MLRKEGVVARVEEQRRHADPLEPGAARRRAPVVVDVAKAMQRRGHQMVELAERARRAYPGGVVQARKALELGERLGPEAGQEVARVEQPVEPAVERAPGRG